MLQPKKVKHRKKQKGRSLKRTFESRGTTVAFGKFGIQALGAAWITAAQIEACRKAIAHSLKKEGKWWLRIFPDKPITQLPPEVTMGGGKGEISQYVCPVKPGRILFELDGISSDKAKTTLKAVGHKLPMKTRFVSRS